MGTIFIPASAVEIHKQQNNKIKELNEECTKISILNCDKDQITINEKVLSSNQIEKVIKAFFETEITEESHYNQARQKIQILLENDLISSDTAMTLFRRYDTFKRFIDFNQKLKPQPAAADVSNIFNLIVFGIKGNKDQALVELLFPGVDFFNGTISGRFALLGQWSGQGFVYTLGLAGFKYLYEFDQDLYPEFPHMPDVKGTNIGFIGIFIDIISINPSIEGQYYIGAGTTLLNAWNKV